MIPSYRWLLFDADGTLFDYDRAEAHALTATFAQFGLPLAPGDHAVYREINGQVWQALERREIVPADIGRTRFARLFAALNLAAPVEPFSAAYLEHLALGSDLMDGAYDVLAALHGRYGCAVITNGLRAVQRSRFARATIRPFISHLIISEEVGSAKPAAGIFDAAFAALGWPAKGEVLMIGDSLSSDIRGAANYGIDAC
jgi:YjjG family noncanonical pyrimidine nucleotidase